jgi:serine/threonine-protein kinase
MIGETVGSWRIERLLWAGGMTHVYQALHLRLGLPAVLKVLLPEHGASRELQTRLFHEARALSTSYHPGVVQVFDLNRLPDGRPYLLLERLDGESLRAALARIGRFDDLPAALSIAAQIAEAAGAIHGHCMVHRNLKPGHVFLVAPPSAGVIRAKVLDLGQVVMAAERPVPQRRVHQPVGTPGYMSPELRRDPRAVDGRTDIYALGCILHEMLCGSPSPTARSLEPAIPNEVRELNARMLEEDPARRPASMGEVAMTLRRIADRLPPSPSPFTVVSEAS